MSSHSGMSELFCGTSPGREYCENAASLFHGTPLPRSKDAKLDPSVHLHTSKLQLRLKIRLEIKQLRLKIRLEINRRRPAFHYGGMPL